MADEIAFPPPGFTAVLVFDDPTPNTVILKRIVEFPMGVAAKCTDLKGEEMNDFIDLILLIARKMLSVYKHKEAYHADERRLEEKFKADPATPRVHSQELFEEFDVFVVQIKSTLDHMVKIMRPMLGRKWTMYTFADKGMGVLTSLQRNTGKHYVGRVKMMEAFVLTKRNFEWLEAVIATRDRANHNLDGGLKVETFAVFRNPDSTVNVPMWTAEQRLATMMDITWENFFGLVEDFIMIALHFRFKIDEWGMFRDHQPLSSKRGSWKVMPKAEADALIAKLGATPL